jgi:L-aminopeptidase/D-esterase-like protein
VVGVDVRGSAPATRETDLCRPGTLVERAQAIFLTGGSAFGLDACAGVMRYLHERDAGFETGVTKVPIVPAAAIFDLSRDLLAWPDPDLAYTACNAASSEGVEQGNVGAGTGATVGKFLGPGRASKGGLGTASTVVDSATIGALIVVNAVGNIVDPETREILAGARDPETGSFLSFESAGPAGKIAPAMNTVIGVVATDAALTSDQINHLARVAHDGIARVVYPSHTLFDGDAIFGLATGTVPIDWPRTASALGHAVCHVVAEAILSAVAHVLPAPRRDENNTEFPPPGTLRHS